MVPALNRHKTIKTQLNSKEPEGVGN